MRNSSRYKKKRRRKRIREILKNRRRNKRKRITPTIISEKMYKRSSDKKDVPNKSENDIINIIRENIRRNEIEDRRPTIISFESSNTISKHGDELFKKITEKLKDY